MTTVCACEKTVVIAKQPAMRHDMSARALRIHDHKSNAPGHLTSMKYELGEGTRRLSLCLRFSCSAEGLRRSTASVYGARDGDHQHRCSDRVSARGGSTDHDGSFGGLTGTAAFCWA